MASAATHGATPAIRFFCVFPAISDGRQEPRKALAIHTLYSHSHFFLENKWRKWRWRAVSRMRDAGLGRDKRGVEEIVSFLKVRQFIWKNHNQIWPKLGARLRQGFGGRAG